MPNWDDLRVFLAVARAQSLSGAGRGLKMDPATVGRRIQRLEEDVNAVLFTKSPQGYNLTADGEQFLVRTEQAEQAITLATEESRDERGKLSGTVRIGATDGCANFLLPKVVTEICDRNPGLDVQIVVQPRVVNLNKREADMAIAVSPPETGRLTVQKITDYKLHLAASRRYLKLNPEIETLEDLKGHKIVGYIPDMIFDKELNYAAATGVDEPEFASNSVAVQLNFLRQNAGVGVLHDFIWPYAPNLRRILPDTFELTRSFFLVRHADDRRVERLTRFAGELVEGLRAEVARLEAHQT
ncbi:LysR family transcriptional regulator [Actibacterium mucosum KCTC 23349]|uniref:LysR family transcriptional regulator n=1 Tax=Actibacterium mucosum KCTC 23349 TaxID=1454373 RepID=A0A037ZDE6_9RHOB|nr:LysR family transcriptional regulator [Actibacterium mucosum]KAJ54489.1 LysR family transcriptional regulator [Actibacterium mucosum KCTC 23349]